VATESEQDTAATTATAPARRTPSRARSILRSPSTAKAAASKKKKPPSRQDDDDTSHNDESEQSSSESEFVPSENSEEASNADSASETDDASSYSDFDLEATPKPRKAWQAARKGSSTTSTPKTGSSPKSKKSASNNTSQQQCTTQPQSGQCTPTPKRSKSAASSQSTPVRAPKGSRRQSTATLADSEDEGANFESSIPEARTPSQSSAATPRRMSETVLKTRHERAEDRIHKLHPEIRDSELACITLCLVCNGHYLDLATLKLSVGGYESEA
jgi:hypothetical protein